MVQNPKEKYLGKWIESTDEISQMFEIVAIDETTQTCQSRDNRTYRFIDLDMDERYEKIINPIYAPEISSQVQAMGIGKKETGDLSAVNKKGDKPAVATTTLPPLAAAADPLEKLIESTILLSQQSGQNSIIPVTINIKLNFDVIAVLKTAQQFNVPDDKALNCLLRYVDITPAAIKELIKYELLFGDANNAGETPAPAPVKNKTPDEKITPKYETTKPETDHYEYADEDENENTETNNYEYADKYKSSVIPDPNLPPLVTNEDGKLYEIRKNNNNVNNDNDDEEEVETEATDLAAAKRAMRDQLKALLNIKLPNLPVAKGQRDKNLTFSSLNDN